MLLHTHDITLEQSVEKPEEQSADPEGTAGQNDGRWRAAAQLPQEKREHGGHRKEKERFKPREGKTQFGMHDGWSLRTAASADFGGMRSAAAAVTAVERLKNAAGFALPMLAGAARGELREMVLQFHQIGDAVVNLFKMPVNEPMSLPRRFGTRLV